VGESYEEELAWSLCTTNKKLSPFLHCPFSVLTWERLAQHLNLQLPPLPLTANLLWTSWRRTTTNKQDRFLWNLSTVTTFWVIWRERNNRIFQRLCQITRPNFPRLLYFYVLLFQPPFRQSEGDDEAERGLVTDERGLRQPSREHKGAGSRHRLRGYVTIAIPET